MSEEFFDTLGRTLFLWVRRGRIRNYSAIVVGTPLYKEFPLLKKMMAPMSRPALATLALSMMLVSGGSSAKESDPVQDVVYENCNVYCANGNQANVHASSLQECTNFAYQLCGGPYQDGQFSYNGSWYAW